MENLRRDVISYVHRLVEERLANDPDRLIAFQTLAAHFDNNRNCTHLERNQMIQQMLGEQNHDLALVYMPVVQEQYEAAVLLTTPVDRASKLIMIAKMCFCIQFMDLYRQRFGIESSSYMQLANAVNLFFEDRMTHSDLSTRFNLVQIEFPDFRSQIEARVNRITSIFRLGGGGAGNSPSL